MDKGYSLRQIVESCVNNLLEQSGIILDGKGGIESPAGSPLDMIVPEAAEIYTGNNIITSSNQNELAYLRQFAVQKGIRSRILFELLDMGYSVKQAFEAILFGEYKTKIWSGAAIFEVYIVDANDDRVAPQDSPRGILSELMIMISGDLSLTLVNGKAKGEWSITIKRDTNDYCTVVEPFGFIWGDDKSTIIKTNKSEYEYEQEGTYQVRAIYTCSKTNFAHSNTLLVEVKQSEECSIFGSYSVTFCDSDTALMTFNIDNTWEIWHSLWLDTGTWSLNGNSVSIDTIQGVHYSGILSENCDQITNGTVDKPWSDIQDCWSAIK